MSPTAQLRAFAQSVYLVIKNRYFDDIDGEDGDVFLDQMIDWTNQFIDELENETDQNGNLVDWNYMRQMGYELGSALEGTNTVDLDTRAVNNLLTDEDRYVQILQDGTPVSNWAVVSPDQVPNRLYRTREDMVTNVGGVLTFSRPFRDTEYNGTVVGDVTLIMPRISRTNVKILSLVKPKQLLILGVAKNATLPDIVQGGLSPSYVQKFNDLLLGAITRNAASSRANEVPRDNFSSIGGVGF